MRETARGGRKGERGGRDEGRDRQTDRLHSFAFVPLNEFFTVHFLLYKLAKFFFFFFFFNVRYVILICNSLPIISFNAIHNLGISSTFFETEKTKMVFCSPFSTH